MNITLRCRGSKREQARPPICAAERRAHRRAGCRGDQSNAALNARVRPNRWHSYRCRGSCSCRPLLSRRRTTSSRHQRSFSVSWASWASTTSPSNASSSLSGVGAVEWKPCAQWSPPGQYSSACPQCRVRCVVGHWHAIVIGRPADRGSAPHDHLASVSRPGNRVAPRNCPSPRHFESEPGSIPVGTFGDRNGMVPAPLPGSLLFIFAKY
jgi:hypothetical protein